MHIGQVLSISVSINLPDLSWKYVKYQIIPLKIVSANPKKYEI